MEENTRERIEGYVSCPHTKSGKALNPRFLNKNHVGETHTMFLRTSISSDYFYEAHVTENVNPNKAIYAVGKLGAENVFKVAKKYNIDLFETKQQK